ncbi:MAG TPA: hypothetical protein VN238_16475, partial [Solirubrobacteraceae bacterium]|nr:hypothetical protein [Solirubrobacteraceae bacterium]
MAQASIEPIASFADAATDWDALAPLAENPFLTRDWAEAWWTAFGAGRELALHRLRAPDGRTLAVLPLYRNTLGPVPVLRFVGHGPADELGPVCAPAD